MEKTIAVLGLEESASRTLIGSIIYHCTPNTLLIETFQHARTRDFTKLLSILEENTAEEENTAVKRFDAPSGGYRVEANGDADVVLWVVDAANGASWVPSARELTTRLNIAAINPRDRLVVVIANLDSVSLSESAVSDAANCFRTIKLEANSKARLQSSIVDVSSATSVLDLVSILDGQRGMQVF